jgi:SSS family solute:Na+ symporter
MLGLSIIIYLLFTVFIGVIASKRVKNSRDFAIANRQLPFFMTSAALFATWFGSETILGSSEEFIEYGVVGIIQEPLGAALCLVIVGLIYAKRMYRTNAMTFSDVFRDKFGRKSELISALVMIPSFFSWIAAQFIALAMILDLLFGCGFITGLLIGSSLVVLYTYLGGMWAVSLNDSIQMVIMVVGLLILAVIFIGQIDGIPSFKLESNFFNLYDEGKMNVWQWTAAWITVGLGSVSSQDVFQRVVSAKSERVAISASIFSGLLYFVIGAIPLLIALVGSQLYPTLYQENRGNFISTLIMLKTPVWLQIIYFGALVSAILSTASGAILAPSTVLAENIIKPRFPDLNLLKTLRWSVIIMSISALILSFFNQSIFELANMASSFCLVSLFIPFTAALFIPATNRSSVNWGMLSGLMIWFVMIWFPTEVPASIWGIFASIIGMCIGQFIFKPKHV